MNHISRLQQKNNVITMLLLLLLQQLFLLTIKKNFVVDSFIITIPQQQQQQQQQQKICNYNYYASSWKRKQPFFVSDSSLSSSSSSSSSSSTTTTASMESTTTATTTTSTSTTSTQTLIMPSQYLLEPIKNIAIVGGTHGNEYTGVWVVREWEQQKQQKQLSYNITTLIGNPIAHIHNKRFMDVDLNRQFALNTLVMQQQQQQQQQQQEQGNSNNHNDDDDPKKNEALLIEVQRAIEINELLGPKTFQPNGNIRSSLYDDSTTTTTTNKKNMDLIIDLHSTTASMDVTLIIPEGDTLMIQAAAYVMYKCNQYYSLKSKSSSLSSTERNHNEQNEQLSEDTTETTTSGSTTTTTTNKNDPFAGMIINGDTSSSSGYSSQNNNNHMNTNNNFNINFETQILIDHVRSCHSTRPFLPSIGKHEFTIEVGPVPQGLLRHDAIIKTNIALSYLLEFIELYNINYNSTTTTTNTNNNNKQEDNDHDNNKLQSILRTMYPNGSVPCFTDLGKIPWPSHPENPNFPTYVVHHTIQDRDFQQVRTGDPLFVSLDGKTIHYDGSYGDCIYLAFVNEGGYYYSSSGTGICALQTALCSIQDGILINYEN